MRWRLVRNAAGELEWERREPVSTKVKQRAKYPIHSEAMGVNIEDIPKAQAILAKRGIQTEYDGAGRPVLRNASHRKRHAEALGFYDRNGGYNDPRPFNR